MTEQTMDPRNEQMGVNGGIPAMSVEQIGANGGVQVMPTVQLSSAQAVSMAQIGVSVNIPIKPEEVLPLNCQEALASYTEAEQKEIMALADSIDVRQIENVMSYGAVALKRTFDQCGDFLKDERGSQADQMVIKQVIELSKRATESYEDFNIELREPGLFQKFLLRLMGVGKNARTKKLQENAATSYKLLADLKASCESWLGILKKAYGEIDYSVKSDIEAAALLEKFIIAGKLADGRIQQEMLAVQTQYQTTGLQQHIQEFQVLEEGYKLFQITMNNLEKSRIMYQLSLGQLALVKRSNRNVQISIHTQVDNSMALIGQQLRNAILDAKTREVLEGQKAIAKFNDELMKEVSKTVGITGEETERLIYAGFYNMEAAKEAVTTVINSCKAIEKTATDMLPKMRADMTQIETLLKELEPAIGSIETLKAGNSTPTSVGSGQLKF